MSKGKITRVIGNVVDVKFDDKIPGIYNALEISKDGQIITLEVQQHIGGGVVRTVAMSSTDGLEGLIREVS